MSDFSIDNLSDVDCILHGRKTGEGFIPYWTKVANNPSDDEHKLGRRFVEIPNAIFSNTLKDSKWDNTTIINGDLAEAIKALKNKDGKSIIVYGGDSFVSSLIQHDLIDEYRLLVYPIVLGSGKHLFQEEAQTTLKLIESKSFDSGITFLHYEPAR